MSKRHHPLIVVLLVVLTLALTGAFLIATNYEVVRKGNLLPYTDGRIYEVLFFDRWTLYLEPESRVNFNSLTAIVLSGTAFVSFAFYRLLCVFGARRERWLFLAMSVGTLYLAADEFAGIHESLGHNMQFLMKLPFVERPDDVIVASYLIPALLFLYFFRSSIFAARKSMLFYMASVACFVLAAILDLTASPGEEAIELLATLLIILGTVSLGIFHTKRAVSEQTS